MKFLNITVLYGCVGEISENRLPNSFQLEFVRHVSISYLGKQTEREEDPDLYEPCL